MLWQHYRDLTLIVIFLFVVLASGGDLAYDLSHGVSGKHVIQESILLTLALVAVVWMIVGIHRQQKEIATLTRELQAAKDQPAPANEQILTVRKQLSQAISDQFAEWELSASEKEVGLFLLKGLSFKEIAGIRGTTEKTVRQQASTIYHKAGLPGRHAFSAWFIEDFL